MEQNNSGDGVIDLSETLSEINLHSQPGVANGSSIRKVPAMYGLMIKLSHGLIKNEKQAKSFLILLILIINLFSFYLIYKQFGGNKEASLSETNMSADAMPA